MKIDDIDRKILKELMQDSRLSMSELGRRINLSSPSVSERVKQMESHGVIESYTTKINHGKLGNDIQCIIEATVKNGDYKGFKKKIAEFPNVDFCYRIAGQACFMLKLHFATFAEAEAFIDHINPFAHTVTHFIFSEVETHTLFTN
ncbi:AsnC family transcriptional regulator [Rossellomorea marisflavi]|uniref:AsnC family transcriptional regulator n=1 Tax=Rossellomorea marisflavi TaxID=189381 RepID=A0A0M0GSX9_9BACI|nr:Lrp/AsnC family transcriptional regulator [Rossellomorea marisflavi]KON92531.1 AsnC family transcriptional regulator [Rossellomorea marisflavi]